MRGEVSATYLDYPKAAERAAQLLPGAKIIMLLREPVSRLVSSFNMKWQVEICGKLTWTRSDCYNGITSVKRPPTHTDPSPPPPTETPPSSFFERVCHTAPIPLPPRVPTRPPSASAHAIARCVARGARLQVRVV